MFFCRKPVRVGRLEFSARIATSLYATNWQKDEKILNFFRLSTSPSKPPDEEPPGIRHFGLSKMLLKRVTDLSRIIQQVEKGED